MIRRLLSISAVVLGLAAASTPIADARPLWSTPIPVPVVVAAYPGCTTHHTYLRADVVDVTRSGRSWTTQSRGSLAGTRVEAVLLGSWIAVTSREVEGGLLTNGIYGRWRLITKSPWGEVVGPAWSLTPDSCSPFVDTLRWTP